MIMARHYRHVPLNQGPRPLAPPTQPDWWRVLRHAIWWAMVITLWVTLGGWAAFMAGVLLALVFYSWSFKRVNPHSVYSDYVRKPRRGDRTEPDPLHPYDNL